MNDNDYKHAHESPKHEYKELKVTRYSKGHEKKNYFIAYKPVKETVQYLPQLPIVHHDTATKATLKHVPKIVSEMLQHKLHDENRTHAVTWEGS